MLVLVVIDGLTPRMLEAGIAAGRTPTLARLIEAGSYTHAVSTFPTLTPVCLSSIATGAHADIHEIPHLTWYHRGERRVVEYGSSFGAIRRNGLSRSLRDALVRMSSEHLGARATTVFEALADHGLTTATVNFTAYRGRTPHRFARMGPQVLGPERFFFYNLVQSDDTGAPLSWRNRAAGTIDAYAEAVARWLVTRDGFDFFLYYLSDLDFTSHRDGPDAVLDTLERTDAAVSALAEAAGGMDELLDRYAVIVMADHGQTAVSDVMRLQEAVRDTSGVLALASNRAGQLYRLERCRHDARSLAGLLDGNPAVELALFREGAEAVARRDGEEVRFAPGEGESWVTTGDVTILDHPDAFRRSWAALANPNAGEVIVSAAPGWEFADVGGGHHRGGGSHGSLAAGDSLVPLISVGVEGQASGIVDVAPLVLRHFGVDVPGALSRAA